MLTSLAADPAIRGRSNRAIPPDIFKNMFSC